MPRDMREDAPRDVGGEMPRDAGEEASRDAGEEVSRDAGLQWAFVLTFPHIGFLSHTPHIRAQMLTKPSLCEKVLYDVTHKTLVKMSTS